MILSTSDFTGFYELSLSIYDTPRLQEAIDRYERYYLVRLFGLTMADSFIADLDNGEPVNPDYLTLFNVLDYEDECHLFQSKGIKDILKACVYYHYISEKAVRDSQSGVVKTEAEVGRIVSFDNTHRSAEIRFNGMLESWETIQKYCIEHSGTYPDFKGKHEYPKYSSLL
jgi:hypothetical protein